MEVLKKCNDYETLLDLALQLQRNPEADKKYLNDADKKELFHQAVTCCVQAFKNKLRDILTGTSEEKNRELLSLMLDIFKAHRKTLKIFQQKDQSSFSGVLVEVYKEYIKDKTVLPENVNFTDLAFKMCQQEQNYRKNLEKGIVTANPNPPMQFQPQPTKEPTVAAAPSPILNIKSVSEINKTILGSSSAQSSSNATVKELTMTQATTSSKVPSTSSNSSGSSARTKPRSGNSAKPQSSASSLLNNPASMNQMLLQMYTNPALFAQMMAPEMSGSSSYMNEYYKTILKGSSGTSASSTATSTSASSAAAGLNANMLSGLTPQQLAMFNDPLTSAMLSGMFSPMGQSSPASSPSNAKQSAYEKKYLESLANYSKGSGVSGNQLLGLQQNLMSNSLSITSTAMAPTSATTSKGSGNKSNANNSNNKANSNKRSSAGTAKDSSPSVSITKLQDNSKYNAIFGSNLKLPDLPKSLSITPSLPSTSSSGKVNRVTDKAKPVKDRSAPSSASLNRTNSLVITPESRPSSNMEKSYYDFLKNYSPVQAPIASTKKSSPINVSQSSLLKPSKHKAPSQLAAPNPPKKSHTQTFSSSSSSASSSAKAAQLSYDFSKNIASSFSGIPLASPTLSKSPFSHNTPPLAHSPSTMSPTKTLQQKLAERKQQNQQQKKKPGELHDLK